MLKKSIDNEFDEDIIVKIKKGELDSGLFLKLKRPYSVDDVKRFQLYLSFFDEECRKDNDDYLINFYKFLTNSYLNKTTGVDRIADIPKEEYEDLELTLFNNWIDGCSSISNNANVDDDSKKLLQEIIKINKPKNIEELRNIFRISSLHNKYSPIFYQEGVGDKGELRSNFVHVRMGQQDKNDYRIYLNPKVKYLPQTVKNLFGRYHLPMYLKFIDYSFNREGFNRCDRIIIYLDRKSLGEKLGVVAGILRDGSERFIGQDVPQFLIKIGDGAGFGQEITQWQKDNFGARSFSHLRAMFIEDVWMSYMKAYLLWNKHAFRKNFDEQYRSYFNKKEQSGDVYDHNLLDSFLDKIWSTSKNELGVKKVKNIKEFEKFIIKFDFIVNFTMRKIIPRENAKSLVNTLQGFVKKLAPKYKINPDNLAYNLE